MKRTYIATTQEAKALHDGTQTAIIVKHSNKQPYAIGQEVVVREAYWHNEVADSYYYKALEYCPEEMNTAIQWGLTWRSPATMPVSAARTRFIPVSCEAVRVRDMIFSQRHFLNVTRQGEHEAYIKSKLDQSAWDNNDYVFYYKIEKI